MDRTFLKQTTRDLFLKEVQDYLEIKKFPVPSNTFLKRKWPKKGTIRFANELKEVRAIIEVHARGETEGLVVRSTIHALLREISNENLKTATPPPLPPSNVIFVDFKRKLRVAVNEEAEKYRV